MLILLDGKKLKAGNFFEGFNWHNFRIGDPVFTEDCPIINDLAVMFDGVCKDTVELRTRPLFWQNLVCDREL